jgi:hypothetical protein
LRQGDFQSIAGQAFGDRTHDSTLVNGPAIFNQVRFQPAHAAFPLPQWGRGRRGLKAELPQKKTYRKMSWTLPLVRRLIERTQINLNCND